MYVMSCFETEIIQNGMEEHHKKPRSGIASLTVAHSSPSTPPAIVVEVAFGIAAEGERESCRRSPAIEVFRSFHC